MSSIDETLKEINKKLDDKPTKDFVEAKITDGKWDIVQWFIGTGIAMVAATAAIVRFFVT